jgi:hypothetical protein
MLPICNTCHIWRFGYSNPVTLEGADIVKFIKSLRLRWCGQIERMNNERMPKKLMTFKMKGKGK